MADLWLLVNGLILGIGIMAVVGFITMILLLQLAVRGCAFSSRILLALWAKITQVMKLAVGTSSKPFDSSVCALPSLVTMTSDLNADEDTTKEEMNVRNAEISDIPDVALIEQLSIPFFWRIPMIRLEYSCHRSGFIVASRNGRVVGYGIVSQQRRINFTRFSMERVAFLRGLAVLSNFRRTGVGTLLIKESIDRIASWGCRELWLEVPARNREAMKFYLSQGFSQVARKRGYYWGEDAIVMRLKISNSRYHQ
jgi:ribosomal-protein-alanine N-acetyltransferase